MVEQPGEAPRERITTAIATILTAGAEAGSLRTDVEPEDVTVMLLGIFLACTGTGTGADAVGVGESERTGRLIDLVRDALRPTTTDLPRRPERADE